MVTVVIKVTLFVPCNQIKQEALTEKEETITSGVSSNTANYLPKQNMVNDVADVKFDDHENQFSNQDVETFRRRRSTRLPKPSMKALEAVVDKYEKETSCKRRRDAETLRKSSKLSKPSTEALAAAVDKYEEETSCKRKREHDIETLRKSSKPSKPSTKVLEAVVDKYEEETICKRRQDVETLRKSRRLPKPSTKALEAIVDKYEEEASCKRRRV